MVNEEKHLIAYPEEYPIETGDEKEWARKNVERLSTQCALNVPEVWTVYASEEGPFEWPEVTK